MLRPKTLRHVVRVTGRYFQQTLRLSPMNCYALSCIRTLSSQPDVSQPKAYRRRDHIDIEQAPERPTMGDDQQDFLPVEYALAARGNQLGPDEREANLPLPKGDIYLTEADLELDEVGEDDFKLDPNSFLGLVHEMLKVERDGRPVFPHSMRRPLLRAVALRVKTEMEMNPNLAAGEDDLARWVQEEIVEHAPRLCQTHEHAVDIIFPYAPRVGQSVRLKGVPGRVTVTRRMYEDLRENTRVPPEERERCMTIDYDCEHPSMLGKRIRARYTYKPDLALDIAMDHEDAFNRYMEEMGLVPSTMTMGETEGQLTLPGNMKEVSMGMGDEDMIGGKDMNDDVEGKWDRYEDEGEKISLSDIKKPEHVTPLQGQEDLLDISPDERRKAAEAIAELHEEALYTETVMDQRDTKGRAGRHIDDRMHDDEEGDLESEERRRLVEMRLAEEALKPVDEDKEREIESVFERIAREKKERMATGEILDPSRIEREEGRSVKVGGKGEVVGEKDEDSIDGSEDGTSDDYAEDFDEDEVDDRLLELLKNQRRELLRQQQEQAGGAELGRLLGMDAFGGGDDVSEAGKIRDGDRPEMPEGSGLISDPTDSYLSSKYTKAGKGRMEIGDEETKKEETKRPLTDKEKAVLEGIAASWNGMLKSMAMDGAALPDDPEAMKVKVLETVEEALRSGVNNPLEHITQLVRQRAKKGDVVDGDQLVQAAGSTLSHLAHEPNPRVRERMMSMAMAEKEKEEEEEEKKRKAQMEKGQLARVSDERDLPMSGGKSSTGALYPWQQDGTLSVIDKSGPVTASGLPLTRVVENTRDMKERSNWGEIDELRDAVRDADENNRDESKEKKTILGEDHIRKEKKRRKSMTAIEAIVEAIGDHELRNLEDIEGFPEQFRLDGKARKERNKVLAQVKMLQEQRKREKEEAKLKKKIKEEIEAEKMRQYELLTKEEERLRLEREELERQERIKVSMQVANQILQGNIPKENNPVENAMKDAKKKR